MARILAIDYGTKRTGLAVTDPEKRIAGELATVLSKDVMAYIKNYITKEEVECIVVGEPKQMDNTPSLVAIAVQQFVNKLKKEIPGIPIERMDERFTSKIAFQSMIDSGLKKSDRRDKGLIDRISATLILQSYLESQDFNKNNNR